MKVLKSEGMLCDHCVDRIKIFCTGNVKYPDDPGTVHRDVQFSGNRDTIIEYDIFHRAYRILYPSGVHALCDKVLHF